MILANAAKAVLVAVSNSSSPSPSEPRTEGAAQYASTSPNNRSSTEKTVLGSVVPFFTTQAAEEMEAP